MRQYRTDKSLSFRFATATILGAGGVALRLAEKETQWLPQHPIWAWLAALLLLSCVGMMLYAFAGPFRCQQCGLRIPRAETAEGAQISYCCPRCDIAWNTGWRVPWDTVS